MRNNKHMEIIIEALQDHRKWFDDELVKLHEVDIAINALNQTQEFFPIT